MYVLEKNIYAVASTLWNVGNETTLNKYTPKTDFLQIINRFDSIVCTNKQI